MELANALQGIEQLGHALERVELALHGDDDAVGDGQRLYRQHAERRGAIDKDVIEAILDAIERDFGEVLILLKLVQLKLRAGKINGRGDAAEIGKTRFYDRFADVAVADDDVVDRFFDFGFLDAEAARGVTLGIHINHKNLFSLFGDLRRDIDAGRRFTDAALLVGKGDDFSHKKSFPSLGGVNWSARGEKMFFKRKRDAK